MFAAIFLLLGQVTVAQVTMPANVETTPADAQGWYALGRARAEMARKSYEELFRKIGPDSAYALAVNAETSMSRQQYRRAFTLFRAALAKDPDLLSARSAMAEIYRSDGHLDWAKQEQAAMAHVDCARHRAACDCVAGRYDAVLEETRADVSAEALYWRAQAYTGLEYEAFGKLEHLPDSVELHRLKAGLFFEAGKRAQVAGELKKALELAPADRELQRDLAMALGAAGDFPAAYRLAQELLSREPRSAELNALAGDALLNRQNPAEAIPYFKQALAADPRNAAAHGSIARAYMQTGEARAAIPHLQAALAADRDGSLHYQLAKAYQQTGQAALAQKAMAEYRTLSAKSASPPEPEITAP